MEGGSVSRRTRSQAGPDWSSKEALILVNEIAAVESDCLKALSSYQKWKIISENCTALDVPRTSNQCRRKWDSLLVEYRMIVRSRTCNSFCNSETESFPPNFDRELFKAIDDFIVAKDNQSDDTDPDGDPEGEVDLSKSIAQPGPKRQKRQWMHVQQWAEEKLLKDQLQEEHEKSSSTEENLSSSQVEEKFVKGQVEKKLENSCMKENNRTEEKIASSIKENEQMMVAKLQENADLIQAIVSESADYSDAGLNNVQDLQSEFVRRQGDKIIVCLGEIVNTLDQFADYVQEHE